MAKKRAAARPEATTIEQRATVTPERFARFHLLLTLLAKAPQTREVLARKLKLDVRGFYRDLEVLRQAGVTILLESGRYHLSETLDAACNRLPFPDPMLTLGEVRQLAKGRGAIQRQVQKTIERYVR